LGDPAARKYDIEAWIPSEKKYRETHSTSTTTDFQSRRLNIRYKRSAEGKTEHGYVHMLNGTAFAIGRIIIAILENYQQADGSVKIPEILIPYCGFHHIVKPGNANATKQKS
jgi:seryl-tRNA synthetase